MQFFKQIYANIFYVSIIITIIILILLFSVGNKFKLSLYIFLSILGSLYAMKYFCNNNSNEENPSNYTELFNELDEGKVYNKFLTTPIDISSESYFDNINNMGNVNNDDTPIIDAYDDIEDLTNIDNRNGLNNKNMFV